MYADSMKKCGTCEEEKSVDDFYKVKSGGGFRSDCKGCHNQKRNERHALKRIEDPKYSTKKSSVWRHNNPEKDRIQHVRRTYGLSGEEYYNLLAKQNGRCAICLSPFSKTPMVDHCHDTGQVRGLLCGGCNSMLGLARDSVDRLRMAIAYLEQA